jgi:hypothetical protein
MNGCRYLATNSKRSALDIVDDLHGIADPEARRLSPGYVDYSLNDEKQSSGTMEAMHVTLLYGLYVLRWIA